jgi:hypothetical protein
MSPLHQRIREHSTWLVSCLFALDSLYLYLNLFTFSGTPYLLGGDQQFFWSDAMRMLQGERAYRDFFQFTAPGTDLYFLGLFHLFGVRIWVTDLAIVLLGIALCWLCFDLASQIMERNWALLCSGIYLVFIYGRLLDATHHWFSLFALAWAIRVLMPARTATRVAIAGALLAIASFFTQTVGVAGLIGLLFALMAERQRDRMRWSRIVQLQLLLTSSFLIAWFLEIAYFIASVGWKQFWYLWVIYAAKNVSYSQDILASGFHSRLTVAVQRLGILGLMLCAYPLTWVYCVRYRSRSEFQNGMQLLLLSLPGFFLMIEVLIKPNWNRIYVAGLPAVVLFVCLLASLRGRHVTTGFKVAWLVVICSGLSQTISLHRRIRPNIEFPAGRAVPIDTKYDAEFTWLTEHTRPGDLFLESAWPHVYLPLKLRSPVFVDGLSPSGEASADYVRLTLVQTDRNCVKYILWHPQFTGSVDVPEDERDTLTAFRVYMIQHYKRVQVFTNQDQIWERQAVGIQSDSGCSR